jgi:hypothetical protein
MTALPARFWAKVDKAGSDGCWNWTGTKVNGYGRFGWTARRAQLAHRATYEDAVAPIPDGLVIDHLCRNTACVNPAHLEAVTQQVNTRRGSGLTAVNAARTHCPQGHEYTPANTYLWAQRGTTRRYCRTCRASAYGRKRVAA